MSTLAPLETLYEVDRGNALPLPPELASIYGRLAFPRHPDRAHVIGNFVMSLDGVTSLQVPGLSGGGPISGFNAHDHLVMGLLRAAADAVIVGAGTLRAVIHHVWTPAYVYPALAGAYEALRTAMGKAGPPLNVLVTASGEVDPNLRVFQTGEAPVLIVTTPAGAWQLKNLGLPSSVQVREGGNAARLSVRTILNVVAQVQPSNLILVEGGPHLLGSFLAEQSLDEQFLTIAPQVAGREGSPPRPGLVAGTRFAPEHPLWGRIASIKRVGNHLFLRYEFPSSAHRGAHDPSELAAKVMEKGGVGQ